MRLGWRYLDTGKSAAFEGEYYSFGDPPFDPWGRRALVRLEISIYLAALRPTMLKLPGEIADGVIGYMMSPKYLGGVVLAVPNPFPHNSIEYDAPTSASWISETR